MLHCSIGQLPVGPSSAVCLNGEWNVELGYCKELHSDGIFSGPSQRRDISISDFKTGSGSSPIMHLMFSIELNKQTKQQHNKQTTNKPTTTHYYSNQRHIFMPLTSKLNSFPGNTSVIL